MNRNRPEAAAQHWKHVWVAPTAELCAATPGVNHEVVERIWLIAPGEEASSMRRSAHASATITIESTNAGAKIGLLPPSVSPRTELSRNARIGVVLHPWITDPQELQAIAGHLEALVASHAYAECTPGLPAPGDIMDLLERLPLQAPDSCVTEVLRSLARSPTRASLAEAVRRSGVSARTIRRKLGNRIGINPDTLRRIKRVEAARRTIRVVNEPLAEVAAIHDFADQAHMTRQFAELCDYTPEQWRVYMQSWHYLAGVTP